MQSGYTLSEAYELLRERGNASCDCEGDDDADQARDVTSHGVPKRSMTVPKRGDQ